MSGESSKTGKKLHLPDLTIKGFRGFENLEIKRLGRVNLIVGKNSVGKSSLLDAVKVYAAQRRYPVLVDILERRDEVSDDVDSDDRPMVLLNWESLFHGRRIISDSYISIGTRDKSSQIRIAPANIQDPLSGLDVRSTEGLPSLEVVLGEDLLERIPLVSMDFYRRNFRLFRNSQHQDLSGMVYQSLGPDVIGNSDLARLWDGVALTDDEVLAEYGLNLIFNGKVERVSMIGDDHGSRSRYQRRAIARIADERDPVPIRSLGEGATRTFSTALALANSRDGFLLIDEVENGLHWSVQYDFWRMVIRTAHENNVQVFATTHSSDSEKWFVKALESIRSEEGLEEVDSAFIRLVSGDQGVYAIEYSEKLVKLAVEIGRELK